MLDIARSGYDRELSFEDASKENCQNCQLPSASDDLQTASDVPVELFHREA